MEVMLGFITIVFLAAMRSEGQRPAVRTLVLFALGVAVLLYSHRLA